MTDYYITVLTPCVIFCNELHLNQDVLNWPSLLSACENGGVRWQLFLFSQKYFSTSEFKDVCFPYYSFCSQLWLFAAP